MKRTKKTAFVIVVLLLVSYPIARLVVPTMMDKKFNRVVHLPPYTVSAQAQQLHDSLDFVADLHSDTLLWKRDILVHNDFGHEDLPRMLAANVALQVFTIVNKVPKGLNFEQNSGDTDQLTLPFILQGRPVKSWFDLTARVVDQAHSLDQFAHNSNGQLLVIRTKRDLAAYLQRRQSNRGISAGLLGIEGGQALQGQIENLDVVFDAGVRMIGLTHFFDNEIGGSAHGVEQGGLTPFGVEVVRRMEQKNMLVDLSHASPKLVDDVLDRANNPVMVSHSGVKGTCDNVRNFSDEHLRRIAESGGVVGIAMFEFAVCGTEAKAIAKAIHYAANLIGVQHVALGSDFDGAIETIFEVRGLPLIVDELLALGMSEADIRLVMGENVRRFFLENLPD